MLLVWGFWSGASGLGLLVWGSVSSAGAVWFLGRRLLGAVCVNFVDDRCFGCFDESDFARSFVDSG